MLVLVHTPYYQETDEYLWQLERAMPAHDFVRLEELNSEELQRSVDYVVTWGPPPNFFRKRPELKGVFALGAGVDALLSRPDLNPKVPIYRLLDAGMGEQMLEYVLYGVLGYQRKMDIYRKQQLVKKWRGGAHAAKSSVRVGVLGAGEMGRTVASGLLAMGYTVHIWSRGPREMAGMQCFHGDDGLLGVLAASDVVVSVLPSTPGTRGLLNLARLQLMPKGSMVINCGRGDVLDTGALVTLLDNGHIRCAQLDVFESEPLPKDHVLWGYPQVTITPHVAALTVMSEAVAQVRDNLERLGRGEAGVGLVRRDRGY